MRLRGIWFSWKFSANQKQTVVKVAIENFPKRSELNVKFTWKKKTNLQLLHKYIYFSDFFKFLCNRKKKLKNMFCFWIEWIIKYHCFKDFKKTNSLLKIRPKQKVYILNVIWLAFSVTLVIMAAIGCNQAGVFQNVD